MMNNKKHLALQLFLIALGCFIIGFAYNAFNVNSGIIIGGLTGICILIADFFNYSLSINLSFMVYYVMINVILLIFALKKIGNRFAFLTFFGMACYFIAIEVCAFAQNLGIPSNDLFLCAIFGGILCGLGVGITIRYGGSTGGAELIACLINNVNNKVSIGTINFIVNALVIGFTIIFDGITFGLYGLIFIYLTGIVTDYVLQGSQGVNAYYIISNNSKELSMALISKLNVSVTAMHATAISRNEETDVLCCVLHSSEINTLKSVIYEHDKNAFVFATKINEAMNKGFSKLEDGSTIISKLKRKSRSYFKNNKKTKIKSNVNEIVDTNKDKENLDKKVIRNNQGEILKEEHSISGDSKDNKKEDEK